MQPADNMQVSRDSVLKIMDEKDKIEKEIEALMGVLASGGELETSRAGRNLSVNFPSGSVRTALSWPPKNRVGLHEPLVDQEGYPRQDVDVYQVRHARHRIACLQNDHKAVMREIEKGIHVLHTTGVADECEPMEDDSRPSGDPIAVVNKVTPGSPASLAGLEVHDKIIEFGSVNASNFQSLLNISFVAESSINRTVAVVVLRDKHVVRLSITPKPWMGPGLLGCNIVLPENVDR